MGFGGGRNIFDEFEAAPGLAGPGGMQGFTSMQTFSGSMGGGMMAGGMGMRSSSTSTRFVNGKKINVANAHKMSERKSSTTTEDLLALWF